MTERKLIVRKTAERNNIDGDFIAQFNPSVIKEMKLTPGEYIIIKNRIDEREFKIAALLQSNDKANKNEIHIDQKIRLAIAVTAKVALSHLNKIINGIIVTNIGLKECFSCSGISSIICLLSSIIF